MLDRGDGERPVLWSLSAVDGIVTDDSMSATTRAVLAGYPIIDAVLLALVLRALAVPHRRRRLAPYLALGVGCWLVSDAAYLVLGLEGRPAAVLDAGWMVGAALIGHRRRGPRTPTRGRARARGAGS